MSDKLADWFGGHAGRRFLDSVSKLAGAADRIATELEPDTALASNVLTDTQRADVLVNTLETYGTPADQFKMKLVWDKVRDAWSETHFFSMTHTAGYWFFGILMGTIPGEVERVVVAGDCGSDDYRSMSMPRLKFAAWLANSDMDYLLGKGNMRKEFDWGTALDEFRAYLEVQRNTCEPEAKPSYQRILDGFSSFFADCDHKDTRDFCDAVEFAFGGTGLAFEDDLAECNWGMRWSPMAQMRYHQLKFFGHWILAREEVLRGNR